MKISSYASQLLILINDHCPECNDSVAYWAPPAGYKQSYSETLGDSVFIDGAGCVSALKSLKRKGLIASPRYTKIPYAFYVTELGRELVEKWKATNTWPTKVRV